MVGSSIIRYFKKKGYVNLLTKDRNELDLINQSKVKIFFESYKPEYVIISAARVGGIYANNKYRADFLYENLQIQNNIIFYAHRYNVKKLIFLGSSCIYPKNSIQPMAEEYLLNGPLESTNEPYAIAKIAGIKLCENMYKQYNQNFYSLMPTNLYGPNDNFNLKNSHVIPALIRKFYEAKIKGNDEIYIWGSGTALREFMYVDDLARACYFFLKNIDAKNIYLQNISHINVGSGFEISINKLVLHMKEISNFKGHIKFDNSMPDGVQKKLLNSERAAKFGWNAKNDFFISLKKTYEWYVEVSSS